MNESVPQFDPRHLPTFDDARYGADILALVATGECGQARAYVRTDAHLTSALPERLGVSPVVEMSA